MNKKKIRQDLSNFYRLLIAERDIRLGIEICENISKYCNSTDDTLYHQLFFSLVIAYSRPFTVSDNIGKLTKKWSKFKEDGMKSLHTELIDYRNKMIAHNDPEIVKVFLIPKGVRFRIGDESIENDQMAHAVNYSIPDIEKIPEYKKLCSFQSERMMEFIYENKDCLPFISSIEGVPFEINLKTINRIVDHKFSRRKGLRR